MYLRIINIDRSQGTPPCSYTRCSNSTLYNTTITYCSRYSSVSSFLQLFCSSCLLPSSRNQHLRVAFPTLLLFQKVPSPANDFSSSSCVQACCQTFGCDYSHFVHSLFPYLWRVLDSVRIWWNHLLEPLGPATKSFLSLVPFLAQEGGEGHMQLLVSKALPTASFYAWTPKLDDEWIMRWALPRGLHLFAQFTV